MTQKGDPYIKLISTLSEVRVLSCVLSLLNILCTSLVKPCYSKNDDSFVMQRSHVTAILRVLQLLNLIEAECSIYQNVQYFIGSKNCVLNFTAIRYSLHKCRKMILC